MLSKAIDSASGGEGRRGHRRTRGEGEKRKGGKKDRTGVDDAIRGGGRNRKRGEGEGRRPLSSFLFLFSTVL